HTQQTSKISISIENDQVYSRPELKDVSNQIRHIDLSPNGERVLLTARGDLYSIPAKEGITYNLTHSSNANDFAGSWSPDGSQIAYISDKTGEFHIWLRNAISGEERQLTKNLKTYIFNLKWSPDSKKILWNEKRNTLNITDIATGQTETIETSGISPIHSYNWSPDSKYVTYIQPQKTMNNILVYDITNKQKHLITDGWYNSQSPNFSKDGKYLVFVSSRTFHPTYSSTEWNHIYNNMQKVYLLPLAKDAEIPFAPSNDQISPEKQEKENRNGEKGKKENPVIYDFTNIENRIIELPVMPSYYYNTHMIGKQIYYNRGGQTFIYNLDSKKESSIDVNISFGPGYKKAATISGKKIQVIDIPASSVKIDKPISLSGVKKNIDYHQEWQQIYNESWRQMRDFFYAKNMHGVDWDSVYNKYNALIPYVNHRTDLTYIIGEMIGELNVGHAYSQNGEHPEPTRIPMGLL
ncbi:MAG: protease, partial [Odoribacter sp.]|nr:protease [Odoribacter sp.]